ncbi:hypothetical protein M8494_04585 [Serratia ureilytica]
MLRLADGERHAAALNSHPEEHAYFGYVDNYRDPDLKKALPPSSLSIVYALPVKSVVERFKMLILNALLLNLLSAIVLFTLAWLFERKMFLPAEGQRVSPGRARAVQPQHRRFGAGGHLYPAHQRRHQYFE